MAGAMVLVYVAANIREMRLGVLALFKCPKDSRGIDPGIEGVEKGLIAVRVPSARGWQAGGFLINVDRSSLRDELHPDKIANESRPSAILGKAVR
jgi:hypothetical protein